MAEEVDPTLHQLMSDNFGPPDGEDSDRVARPREDRRAPRRRAPRPLDPPERRRRRRERRRTRHDARMLPLREGGGARGVRAVARGEATRPRARYRLLGAAQQLPAPARRERFDELLASVRLRVCPFALSQHAARGRGLLLLQSDCSLAQFALPAPRDCWGRVAQRSLVAQYLVLDELDEMYAAQPRAGGGGGRDPRWTLTPYAWHDFSNPTGPIKCDPCRDQLLQARPAIRDAVESHDVESEVVVVARLRCGFVAAVVTALVPEYRVCARLAEEYAGLEMVQLDLDDL
ncbi:hypothetical protein AB1Y20_021156 [Prymnesium parvum]|uniref:Uncharacterized protein n=1 Tax=Prymnesium parvum TaxID=97485 RepID=A0AB34JIW6_PRYPA